MGLLLLPVCRPRQLKPGPPGPPLSEEFIDCFPHRPSSSRLGGGGRLDCSRWNQGDRALAVFCCKGPGWLDGESHGALQRTRPRGPSFFLTSEAEVRLALDVLPWTSRVFFLLSPPIWSASMARERCSGCSSAAAARTSRSKRRGGVAGWSRRFLAGNGSLRPDETGPSFSQVLGP